MLYGRDSFGRDKRVLLWVDEIALAREVRVRGASFENSLYNLFVDGVKTDTLVLPRDLAMQPST